MFELFQFFSFRNKALGYFFILSFLGFNQFLVGLKFVFELKDFFSCVGTIFLSCGYGLFSGMIEVVYFLIDQLHFLYFPLNIHVLVFFCLESQLDIVDHFLVFSHGKGDLFVLINHFSSSLYIKQVLPSNTDFCSNSRSSLFFKASAWACCCFPSISTRAFSHSNCLNCSPQQLNYLSREWCISWR